MPSQFFGLNIAYSGLLAANAGINTTGNNISNVETEGYSRQVVKQQAADALRTFTTYGSAGAGVETLAIERIRNEFYDIKYWNNNADLGEYSIKQYYMRQIEDYFNDDPEEGIEGFSTIFTTMYEALAEVKKNAGDGATKNQFIGFAKSLTEYFNSMANDLQKVQKDCNAEIKNKVDEVNTIAAELSTLNQQINVIELSGTTANELRDRRSLLIDQLSAIVDVEVKELPITDSRTNEPSGANRYLVKIAGGQTLVDGGDYNTLSCVARESSEKVNQMDADGLYDIEWSNGLEINLYGSSLGGELKALLQMRDGNNGKAFDGAISKIENIMDGTTVAGKKVTVDVTKDYLKDFSQCGLSDTGGYIMLGGNRYHYSSWEMKQTVNTDGTTACSYSFNIDSDANVSLPGNDVVGREARQGKQVGYMGVPYYMAQMNEWVRNFAKNFNETLTQPGAITESGDPGIYLFAAEGSGGQNKLEDQEPGDWTNVVDGTGAVTGKTLTITSGGNNYYNLTALNFTINEEMNDRRLATHTGSPDEKDKYDVVDDLISLKTDRSKMTYRNCAAGEFLDCIMSDVTLSANNANSFYSNYSNIATSIQNQRTSVSGVDNDEEALNLVKYQNAYSLASKMIQTLTEVYDRLILSTGV